VRRALAHALDLDAVSEAMGEGMRPVTGYQPPTSFAYAAGSARPFPHDPPRARALLDRAGWRDADRDGVREKAGRDLELTLYANDVPETFPRVLGTSYTPVLERIAADWEAVGVRVAVREEGWEALAGRLFGAHDFDAALLSVSGDADPDASYLWGTEAYADGFNAGRYSDEVVDALLDEGLYWRDAPRRVKLYADLDRLLAEDAPAIPIGATRVALVRNNRLVSTADTYWAAIQHADVEKWYVEDGR
jgi:peptide/nickel transport system substrate-binding protein